MNQTLLLIEDDAELASMLEEYLSESGFELSARGTGETGLAALARADFDVVVLDLMLPDMDGFEVCRRIRASSDVPVLMLTARGEETDRIVGLELGADDYLPKPFNPRELLARLRAVLRRRRPGGGRDAERLRFGDLEIDLAERQVRVRGQRAEITAHQFDIVRVLAENAGRVMSREALLERVRGEALELYDRSIDVHISRIRAAIEDDARKPRRILTVRGVGYVFARHQVE